jgi:hypothetical protein
MYESLRFIRVYRALAVLALEGTSWASSLGKNFSNLQGTFRVRAGILFKFCARTKKWLPERLISS